MPDPEPTDDGPVPSDRPIIAFFDVDNTLLRGASAFHVGVGAFRRRMVSVRDIATFAWHQARFLRVGENAEHLAHVRSRGLELAAGKSVAQFEVLANEIYDRAIAKRLWPESVELAREHLRKGHEVWLVSATPQIVAEVIAERLGVTGALGTVVEHEEGVFTGRITGEVMHGAAKAHAAERLAVERGASLADCWAYSDSNNDIPLLSLVGNRVVVNPDASLEAHAQQEGWDVMRLHPSSIRDAQRRVRREAKAVKKQAR